VAKRVKLSDTTKSKIEKFLESNKDNQNIKGLSGIMDLVKELPVTLRSELILEMHGDLISAIKRFPNKDPEFLWKLFSCMRPIKTFFDVVLYN